jgi:hypothetical protein
MNLFTLEDLTLEEIATLRHSLNVIDIKGSSAQFIANLQIKLDKEIKQIQEYISKEENKKQEGIKSIEKSAKTKS